MGAPDKELELEFDFDMEIDEEPKDEESKGDIKPECMIYLKKASDLGHVNAMCMYANRCKVLKDIEEAKKYYLKAFSLGKDSAILDCLDMLVLKEDYLNEARDLCTKIGT